MQNKTPNSPSVEEAENAVRVLLRWLGDSPDREELLETPKRVLDAYKRSCSGYSFDDASFLKRTILSNDMCYSDMVIVKEVGFSSHCEHHLSPVRGMANVAYVPRDKILGIGGIVEIIDGFARKLQLQERLSVQIAEFVEKVLNPHGVAVLLEAEHWCMECYRNISGKCGLQVQTGHMLGIFKDNERLRAEFLSRLKI